MIVRIFFAVKREVAKQQIMLTLIEIMSLYHTQVSLQTLTVITTLNKI